VVRHAPHGPHASRDGNFLVTIAVLRRRHAMGQVVVRYKVKPDRVEENERLVRRVYEELGARDPGGIKYATLKLSDGVTFVHVASVDGDPAENPLLAIDAFREFTRDIAERCDEPPVALDASVVGSYGLFG
jgi:hypothetical protein